MAARRRWWMSFLSLAATLALAVVPLPDAVAVLRPDWVAVVLLYWSLMAPRHFSLLTAFWMGIALDTLFNHRNVGPFIGKQLIQRMVTSNPSPAYVGRVAAAFNNNGSGVRGDMKAVWRAVLLDPEARADNAASTSFGKVREPILRLAHRVVPPENRIIPRFRLAERFERQILRGHVTPWIDVVDRDIRPTQRIHHGLQRSLVIAGFAGIQRLAGAQFAVEDTGQILPDALGDPDERLPPHARGAEDLRRILERFVCRHVVEELLEVRTR